MIDPSELPSRIQSAIIQQLMLPSKAMRSSFPLLCLHWIILPSCEVKMEWNTGQVTFSSILQSLATNKGPK